MMMMMMMMMNYFCGMVDQRKMFSLISSQDHRQRFSPLQISNTPQVGFEPARNLSSSFVEWSCVVVITTAPWHHGIPKYTLGLALGTWHDKNIQSNKSGILEPHPSFLFFQAIMSSCKIHCNIKHVVLENIKAKSCGHNTKSWMEFTFEN